MSSFLYARELGENVLEISCKDVDKGISINHGALLCMK